MSATQSDATRPARAGGASAGGHRKLGLALVVIATAQLMVVLDATIVNVALPDIAKALGFSGTSLEWVVNAYALTFGGLLLLGGRAGDILGRRRVFIAGIILFSLASLLGGFATTQAWLLAARAVQGVGGAIIAPTALSLITTTFPEGPPRNRAMGVYAAMSIGGAAVGLMAGGLLTTYLSWRWVLFVNVPIGVAVALLRTAGAHRIAAPPRPVRPARRDHQHPRPGRPGLRPDQRGDQPERRLALGRYQGHRVADRRGSAARRLRHDRDTQRVRADAAADLPQPRPVRRQPDHAVRRHRDVRDVLLPDHLRADRLGLQRAEDRVAYLPMVAAIMVMAGVSAQLVPRIGARPLLIAGSAIASGGMFWLSRISEHSTYTGGLLGPMLVTAAGLGMVFMPLTLVALSQVRTGTQAWRPACPTSASRSVARSGWPCLAPWPGPWWPTPPAARAAAAASAAKAGHPRPGPPAQIKAAIYDHALSVGFSRGFEVSAGITLHRPVRDDRRHPGQASGPGRRPGGPEQPGQR